jgi:hypothetical protein
LNLECLKTGSSMLILTLRLWIFLLCLSITGSIPVRHQDTRTLRPEDVKGSARIWKADLSFNYFETEGNIDMRNRGAGFVLFREFDRKSIYLKGDYENSTFFNSVLQDKKSLVLRYDLPTKNRRKWIFYSTYGESFFTQLDNRFTYGFGPWIDLQFGKLKHGLSLVIAKETERLLLTRKTSEDTRWSLRDVGTLALNESVNLGYDFFFIPKIGDFKDHRLFFSGHLDSKLTKNVSTRIGFTREYDSNPPPGVKKADNQVTLGMVFNFGQ